MDLKKLKHAVTLADEGSFAKAALRLHISQPALTRSIQALEQDLGVTLFDRHPSGVWTTSAGRLLLSGAEALLRSAKGLQREAELIRDAQRGSLTLGMGPVPAQSLLPRVLAEVMGENSEIQLQVEVQPGSKLLEMLLDESIEFFVSNTHGLVDRRDITIAPLGALPLGFYVRRGHPLLSSPASDFAQLQRFSLVSHGLNEQQIRQSHPEIVELSEWPGRLACENILILKTVALETDAILMTARNLVDQELLAGELVPLRYDFTGSESERERSTELGVVRLANRSLSPLAKLVIEKMESEVARSVRSESG